MAGNCVLQTLNERKQQLEKELALVKA